MFTQHQIISTKYYIKIILNDYQEAISAYSKEIEIDPNDAGSYALRGCEKLNYGDYQGAIDDAGGRGFMFKDLSQATNYVKEAIKEINENRKISFPATKPYGCSVKYKS